MKKNTCIKLSATALAVLLIATMFSLPAAAKGIGPDRSGQTHGPEIGPYDPPLRIGPYVGKTKGEPRKGESKYKIGCDGWRALKLGLGGVRILPTLHRCVISLTQPVWMPEVTFDQKPQTTK